MKLELRGELPEGFERAYAELSPMLSTDKMEKPLQVTCVKQKGLSIAGQGRKMTVGWEKPAHLWRALALVKRCRYKEKVDLQETPAFEELGFMMDVSRNAVLTVESVKNLLRHMALMGFDFLFLYTEDTFEVEKHPYVGWLRGRYSIAELREIDDYAALFGIEVCPYIQTLGHLNRVLHWPQMAHLKDTEEILLAGSEEVYAFIEDMVAGMAKALRSRRIHIGMDEAPQLGQGRYQRLHGHRPAFDILTEHLARVREIVLRYGYAPMMSSDTYFRLLSPTGGYYDSPAITPEIAAKAPADIALVYWDYYHADAADYRVMLQKHRAFKAPLVFSGSVWSYCGPVPDYKKTVETTVAGLAACMDEGVKTVFCTAWGDNGAECPWPAMLLGMQLYAELCYTRRYDMDELSDRFESLTGLPAEAFWTFSAMNTVPGMKTWSLRPVNASKFMLYQDPLLQMYEKDTEGLDMAGHYQKLAEAYGRWAKEEGSGPFPGLFEFYHLLALTLAEKCAWHQQAGRVARQKDRTAAHGLAKTARQTAAAAGRLKAHWRSLWEGLNKPYGFEITEIRLGGMIARMGTAAEKMEAFANGSLQRIEELCGPALPYTLMEDGALRGSYAWGEIVSPCRVDLL